MYCPQCGQACDDADQFCRTCGAPPSGGVATLEPQILSYAAPATLYAGFWARWAAAFLDGIILLIAQFIVGFVIGLVMARSGQGSTAIEAVARIVGTLMNWFYYAIFESSALQATLGKKALGIAVTDMNGGRISFGRATGRYFAKILSALILFVGFIMAGFTARKQALHDMIAGTLVIRKA
jgi:uncharacterized RDD family membrane protein YckC